MNNVKTFLEITTNFFNMGFLRYYELKAILSFNDNFNVLKTVYFK